MRTTITLEDDVVALIEEVRRAKHLTFRQAVNEGLREGLAVREQRAATPFRTRALDIGAPLIDLRSVSAALEEAEGSAHR